MDKSLVAAQMPQQDIVEVPSQQQMINNSSQSHKYQQLIKKINVSPRYQYMLVIFICISWFTIIYNAMIGSFVFMNPLFQCQDQSATQEKACSQMNKCIILNDFTAVKYDKLYCDKQNIRSLLQSLFAVGCAIGMASMPIVGDIIGRRKTMLLALLLNVLSTSLLLIGINYNIQFIMMIGIVLAGASSQGISSIGFISTCDFCQENLREKSFMLYFAFCALGQMSFYIFYFYMPQWNKYLCFALLIPTTVMFILAMLYFIQSPAYAIYIKRDEKQFKLILNKIKKWNKIATQNMQQIQKHGIQIIKIQNSKQKKQIPLSKSLKKILGEKQNAISCVCMILAFMSNSFFYYGMQGTMERTGYNFGTSMLLSGLHEFLGYLSCSYLTKYIPRKKGAIFTIALSSLFGLAFLFRAVEKSDILQSILISLIRIACVYAYSFLILLECELFDVQLRPTGYAIIDSFGQIGRITVPFIINWLNNIGIRTLVVSSIVFLILGTIPIFFVRETLKRQVKINSQEQQTSKEQFNVQKQKLFK